MRRWRGCAVSAINNGAAVCEIPRAIPVPIRAAKKTQWFCTAVWTIAEDIASNAPKVTHALRPRISAM